MKTRSRLSSRYADFLCKFRAKSQFCSKLVQRALCLSEKRGRKEQLQVTEQLISVSILDNSSFDRELPNAVASQ